MKYVTGYFLCFIITLFFAVRVMGLGVAAWWCGVGFGGCLALFVGLWRWDERQWKKTRESLMVTALRDAPLAQP